MCDDKIFRDEMHARIERVFSRRHFNLLVAGAAAVALLPGRVSAADVRESTVDVTTPHGVADCFFAHPTKGRHPGVVMWPDFIGRRTAYHQLAARLAESGYAVLVVNPYYRSARAPVLPRAQFGTDAGTKRLHELAAQVERSGVLIDARACVDFLDAHAAVDTERGIGTMGYCFGGAFAFYTASAVPDRIAALATFHAGGLVSEGPDSVHLLVGGLEAQALIAIAESDVEHEPMTQSALRAAFADARLPAEIEVYEGTRHGWCTPDMVAYYDEAQAQRAWRRLLALLDRSLA
jgi:carboxymethylenebutenolidase